MHNLKIYLAFYCIIHGNPPSSYIPRVLPAFYDLSNNFRKNLVTLTPNLSYTQKRAIAHSISTVNAIAPLKLL